jgi:large subunit ribosomal protein L23
MGLFGKKKVEETTAVANVPATKPALVVPVNKLAAIIKPRITEKAALLSDKSVYTFEIQKGATKFQVRDAIQALYKVTPKKIRIVNQQPRHTMSRAKGREVMVHGLRKAYVYLQKGDRIELV